MFHVMAGVSALDNSAAEVENDTRRLLEWMDLSVQ